MQRIATHFTAIICVVAFGMSGAATAQIEKPELDLRDYQSIELDNGLDVLLISDEDTTVAGAGVSVAVGSDQDPENLPGLAHLLEHMVFAGSEAYPEQGGFPGYVNRSGGAFNGYTAQDLTSFFFQVGADSLKEGLARFADFLAKPSLAPDAVAGEVDVVQSEFEGRRSQQKWRAYSVFKQVTNPDHPFSGFASGNAESFEGVDAKTLAQQLEDWHDRYYVPSGMKLVVIGPSSTEKLAELVRQRFGVLPTKEAEGNEKTDGDKVPLVRQSRLPHSIRLNNEGQVSRLTLSFPITPEHRLSRTKPFTFISHLLTSQEQGRLLPLLREKGWASNMAVTSRVQADDYATLDVMLPLTEDGAAHHDEVIGHIFAYLKTLQSSDELEPLYRKQQRQAQEQFRHPQEQPVMSDLARLSVSLQRYPMEEVLSGPRLLHEFDADAIQGAFDSLKAERVIVTRRGEYPDLPKTDPVSGSQYAVSAVASDTIADWRSNAAEVSFAIETQANPFRAASKSVHPLESEHDKPQLLQDADGFRLWHQQDMEFRNPRGLLAAAIESDVVNTSDRARAIHQLYLEALREALNPLSQQGADAGLSLNLSRENHGLVLSVGGFSEKQPMYFRQVVQQIRSLEITPALLERAKARASLRFDELQDAQPFKQLITSLESRVNPGVGQPEAEMEIIRNATVADLAEFHRGFWQGPAVEMMVYGNYTPSQAETLSSWMFERQPDGFDALDERLPAPGASDSSGLAMTANSGSAALIHVEAGDGTTVDDPVHLAAQMLHGHIFRSFRQGEEKGYIAFGTLIQGYQHRGLTTVVQAPGREPEALLTDLESANESFLERLGLTTQSTFNQFKSGLEQALGARKQSLPHYGNYWWSAIRRHGKPLDEAARIEKSLESLTLKEFRQYCQQLLNADVSSLNLSSAPG